MPSALANRRRAIAACSQKLKSSTEKYIYARGLLFTAGLVAKFPM